MKLIREHDDFNFEDDFDWIRETQPLTYEYLVGKALEFNPPIADGGTLMSILNYFVNIGFIHGSWPESMDWYNEKIIGLYFNPNGRIIWTGDYIAEDYQYHINDYAEKDVEVLNGWNTISGFIGGNTIKESENPLQWIMDEDPTEIIFQPGDRVTVHNVGDEEPYISWLGMYDSDYIDGNYGEKITGEVIGTYEAEDTDIPSEFVLVEDNTGDQIYFPYKAKMEKNNLKLIYELLE